MHKTTKPISRSNAIRRMKKAQELLQDVYDRNAMGDSEFFSRLGMTLGHLSGAVRRAELKGGKK